MLVLQPKAQALLPLDTPAALVCLFSKHLPSSVLTPDIISHHPALSSPVLALQSWSHLYLSVIRVLISWRRQARSTFHVCYKLMHPILP